jgi:hypothetical protein
VIEGLPCFDPRTTKGKKKKNPTKTKKNFKQAISKELSQR